MKAIKLASVFAVTAVAVAVSSATFAAEPVFKGTAGLEYASYEDNSGKSDKATSRGEVNIIGDTGVVYFDLDMEGSTTTSDGGFDLDEIYIKQGAVQFGDFDGTILDSVAYSAGVEQDEDTPKNDFGDDLGIRYMVNDELTVALEITEGTNVGSLAVAYETEFSGMTLGVSAGYKMSDDNLNDQLLTVGVKAPLGMATLSSFVRVGSIADADIMNTGVGIDLPVSEQLTLAAQYYVKGGESAVGVDEVDQGIFEATAYYAVGDVKYYASYVDFELDNSDYSVVGAKVSF
ncbi:hypothetical protein A8139_18140 [Marinomonas primoryensis]|uniref:Porin domain-containing protein n=1 Tax=Marinomonas primoryensis TaxID=178399 RepID=A0A2Z4PW44_9GAMM|nr:hypothetical protein [Marinomonas primoryensis]AWY01667.1 hypothetical protein A8139_18140 [Marinomonas primoryensis]